MKQAKFFLLFVILLALPMIQNCGSSSNGGGTSDIIVADKLMNAGWDSIKLGNYTSAKASFKQALNEPLTDSQKVSVNSGMGWALSKNGEVLESIPYFEVAANQDNEAKVGLAGALIYRHQSSYDYVRAAELLGNMPPEKFGPIHSGLALNSAKVHALTALAYGLSGDIDNARIYMNKADALDSMMVGTSVDKMSEAFFLLGWKDNN